MNKNIPIVSIVMPVFNGAKYLRDAIDSIINQTYEDYELIIVNDGSTDDTQTIIDSYSDNRIIKISNSTNYGLVYSLNLGIKSARGIYIARMDSDDICHKNRIMKQVSFLDKNDNVAVVGTWCKVIGVNSNGILRYPSDDESLKCMLLFAPPFAHPSVMIRKTVFENEGILYDINYAHAEDYMLWVSISSKYMFWVIDEVLLEYRIHRNQVTSQLKKLVIDTSLKIQKFIISEKFGINCTDEESKVHAMLSLYDKIHTVTEYDADKWLCNLYTLNQKNKKFDNIVLLNTLIFQYYQYLCKYYNIYTLLKMSIIAKIFKKNKLCYYILLKHVVIDIYYKVKCRLMV